MEPEHSKEAAEILVKETFEGLKEARRVALDHFIKACQLANKVHGVSDEKISKLIEGGYSRARIGQLRAGKIGKRNK